MQKYAKRTFLLLAAAFLLFTCVTFISLFMLSSGFDPGKLKQGKEPTLIKDVANQVVFKIQPPGPQAVPLSQIPLNLQHGVIAIEDSRFYENSGVDTRSLVRAVWVDLTHGSAVQGASTIPEQLAKIVYLTDSKTFKRKIQQIIYGIDIEKNFTKDDILDFYLNRVYLGHGATGVQAAAEIYFNKPVSQLDLAQCALLAGLPQAPSYYDPYVNKSDALSRRNLVLQKMLEQHYITNGQYQAAIQEPIHLTAGGQEDSKISPEYQYYRDYLYEEADQLGISASLIADGGVTVYTSLNPQLQKAAYNAYQDPQYFPPDMSGERVQSGAVFLDPKTGGIEALIGGRGTYVERGLDHASQIHRSPGSSIKPLIVYGPAIESGQYTPDSLLFDGDFNVGGYQPHDWEPHATFDGKVTLREALAMSWNIPAVWLLQQIGTDTGIRFASKAGLHFTDSDAQKLGIALGDISQGTNPLQMANAYAAFDHAGIRVQAHAIQKIEASDGSVIYEASPQVTNVMSPSTANTLLGLLQNDVINGIADAAQVAGWGVAGKTGSTENLNQDQDKDVWFCGFTPTVVGSIWMGFDQPDANHFIPVSSGGSRKSAELFSAILQAGLNGPGQQFDVPVNSAPERVIQQAPQNEPPKGPGHKDEPHSKPHGHGKHR